MENQIRLKWTSHLGTLLSVFDALLSTESLVDVTLACEGQYIRAHKMILSACSPYLQDLINVDVNKHPIFFLNDVKYTELKALIHFMYRGEVNIAQEDLPSLLAVAQALKIRGLAEIDPDNDSISNDNIIVPDIGAKRVQPPPPPAVDAVPSPPVVIPTVSSDLPRTSIQSQRSIVSQNLNSCTTASIPTTTGSGPPDAKKSRIETQFSSVQTPQLQIKLSRVVDPRSEIQPSSPTATAHFLDPLQTTSLPSISSSHYHLPGAGHSQDAEYDLAGMVEDTEAYGSALKVEATGAIEIDFDGEEHNTMNRSSFSESWQLGDGDNSGMADDDGEIADDDGEIAGGSGGGEDDGGGEGGRAEGGEVRRQQKEGIPINKEKTVRAQGLFQCPNFSCNRVYKRRDYLSTHLRFECNRSPQFCCTECDYKARRKHHLQKHTERKHKELK